MRSPSIDDFFFFWVLSIVLELLICSKQSRAHPRGKCNYEEEKKI